MNQYSYISSLDINKLNLYSLQLANMKRIENNDVVYIFDEVGAGKTVSAGLCTIQLLFQHIDTESFNNVLVITAPSVVEQFSNKFESLLELNVNKKGKHNNKEYSIDIINYDYRNIKKVCKNYDFIIIDEAHEFLNEETQRYKELIKLKAKKVLFLTATPIKHAKRDLECYPKIASEITGIDYELLKSNLLEHCQNNNSLSSGFNPNSPVSRYFKETVKNIEKVEDGKEFRDKEPIRLVPELWENNDNKDINIYLAEKIESNYDGKNKFVVFVRLRKDASKIADALMSLGYNNYLDSNSDNKTFCVITGETENRRELLNEFSTADENDTTPDILILTYKISEQGIDLPSYNYIINYHIPASPSQLEQRFGRIDRLNSIHNKLNTCFVVTNNWTEDSNTANFYTAISTYINEFLPLIPSKNSLITPKILEAFNENNNKVLHYYELLGKKISDDCVISKIHILINDLYKGNYFYSDSDIDEVIFFIIDRNIEFDENIDLFKKNIYKEVKKCIQQIEKSKERIEWWRNNINQLGNNIFFINSDNEKLCLSNLYNIETIDPKEAAKMIVESTEYIDFSREIKIPIEKMRIWNNVKQEIEEEFEEAFHQNNFEFLFPKDKSYNYIWNKYFSSMHDLFSLKDINEYVGTLNFFKMCAEYGQIVQGYAYNDKGYLYEIYDFNPFYCSIRVLSQKSNELNLNKGFFNKYIDSNNCIINNLFSIKIEDGFVVSSNWLKLFYKYSRKEAFAIASMKEEMEEECMFNRKLSIHTGNSEGYIKETFYKVDYLFSYIEEIKFTKSEEEALEVINEYDTRFKKNCRCIWSLFNHFLYTMSNNKRKYTKKSINIDERIYSIRKYDSYITENIVEDLKPAIIR